MKKAAKWTLVIAFMITIFIFSNMPATESDQKSMFVIHVLDALGVDLNSIVGDLANFLVRKAAHFSEYFILYLLVLNAMSESMEAGKARWMSLLIVFLYASSDEFHQMFVPGRACRFTDVMIDTSGGCLALMLNYIGSKFKRTT